MAFSFPRIFKFPTAKQPEPTFEDCIKAIVTDEIFYFSDPRINTEALSAANQKERALVATLLSGVSVPYVMYAVSDAEYRSLTASLRVVIAKHLYLNFLTTELMRDPATINSVIQLRACYSAVEYSLTTQQMEVEQQGVEACEMESWMNAAQQMINS